MSTTETVRRPDDGTALRLTTLDGAILAVVLALGLINLAQPFSWDQSLFAMSARKLGEGGTLYGDVWDTKPPGIHLFYTLATRVFGSSEIGVHALELLWMLALSWLLQRVLARRVRYRWTASLVPLFTAGFYYAVAEDRHMAQIEGLIGLPLFCALWLATRVDAEGLPRRGTALFAGIAGSVVLLFQFAYAPLLLCFWIPPMLPLFRDPGRLRRALPALGAMAAGLLVPVVLTILVFQAQGVLGAFLGATLVYPGRVIANIDRFRLPALVDAWRWFLGRWSPLLGFGFVGAVTSLARGRDPFVQGLVLWLAGGVLLLLLQITSVWQYQFLLLSVPAGVLAVLGIDALADAWIRFPGLSGRTTAVALAGCAALLFAWPLSMTVLKVLYLSRDHFALTEAGRIRFTNRMSRDDAYSRYRKDVEFVRAAGARPGPIFVVGDPLVNWLAGRPGILARDGGNLVGYMTADEWRTAVAALREGPPAYLYVERRYDEMMAEEPERWAPFVDYLEHDWALVFTGTLGAWYAPRSPAR